MSWLTYTLLAVVALFLLKKMLPSPRKLGAATNALLAEHLLQHVEFVPENPFARELKQAVINVWLPQHG